MPLYNPPAVAGTATASLVGPASITTTGDSGTHALDFIQNTPTLGAFSGLSRTYFGRYSQLESQAWMTISGLFNDSSFDPTLTANQIQVIYPGAHRGNPTLNVGNRINGFSGGMLGITNDVIGPNLALQDNHLSSGIAVAIGATPIAGGAGYSVGDVLTMSSGTPIAATLTSLDSLQLNGAGYTVGDILTVSGGIGSSATIRVTAVATAVIASNGLSAGVALGGILAASLVTPGVYSVLPSSTTNVTGGTGSGAYVNLVWPSKGPTLLSVASVASGAITALAILRPGAYPSQPTGTVTLTGGTGTGATAVATWSTNATTSRHLEVLDYTKSIRWQMRGDGTQVWGNAQDIDLFVASNADLYGIDNNNLGTHATFNAPSLVISGDSQLGNCGLHGATRTIAAAPGSTTAIGSFLLPDPAGGGACAMRIMLNVYGSAIATSKIFDLVVSYNLTSGVWWQLVPVVSVLQPGYVSDHALDASVSGMTLSLRVRNVSATATARAEVSMIVNGPSANAVFTPALTTATGIASPATLYTGKPPTSVDTIAKNIAVPVDGGTVTIPLATPLQIINPAAALSLLSIALPAGPADGQKQVISFQRAVTSVYVSASGASNNWAGPAPVTAFQRVEFTCNSTNFAWYRTQ